MYNFHVINRLASFLKRFLQLNCLLLFVLAAGCKADPHLQPGPDAGREIDVVAAVPAGVEAKALRAAADAYRLETGLIVQVMVYPIDMYFAKLEGILLAGRSDFDLVYLPANQLARWVGYSALQPITDAQPSYPSPTMDNAEIPRSLHLWATNLTVSDRLYGFPTQPAVEGIWYRADLLAQAGAQPPATWDDVRELALALHRPPDLYGLAMAAGDQAAGAEFAALLAGFGGQVYRAPASDPDSVVLELQQPAAQKALAYYASLWQEPAAVSSDWLAAGRAAARDALRGGRAAMAILPLTDAPLLQDCAASPAVCASDDGEPPKSSLAFAALPGLPSGAAVGELGAWAVPYHAGRSQAAKDFAAWLVSAAGARVWAQNGGIPAWQGLADDPLLAEQAPYLAVLDGIESFRLPVDPVRNMQQVNGALHAGVHALATGQADQDQAAAGMEDALRGLLHQAGYSTR